jgi:methionyl-tRNA synthetase
VGETSSPDKKIAMARILITSALPYINGVKHLGNLAGSMLPADVYARFQRLRGHEVLSICATDEHGTPAELAAAAAGQDVRSYCDEQHEVQKGLGERYGLAWDHFGRTSSDANKELTQHFAEVLEANGLIEEVTEKQVFSIDDDRFLPDRYVEGTCPHCGYEKARGDQCDNCGKLLDPIDLIEPYSAVSGSRNLEVRDTRHLRLKQTAVEDRLRDWVNAATDWPPLAKSIANKWLDEGLRDRTITRDLKWGVPVVKDGAPRPGFEDKVFYVWFDAPIGYIAATREWAEKTGQDWERWWRKDKGADDVSYVQFMGKDNVAFHTVSFPATLLGSKEPWKTVDKLKAFNWLNWYGGKFSTSNKRGVFMDQALELLPADYWRWYLTAYAPEGADAQFTWEHFQGAINTDLANVLGNFVNRILKFANSRFDGVIPEGGNTGTEGTALSGQLVADLRELTAFYEAMEFRKAAAKTREIWASGNEYLQRVAPWALYKTDPTAAGAHVREALNLCRIFAVIARPIIPSTADKVLACLGVDPEMQPWPAVFEGDNPNEPNREIRAEMTVLRAGQAFTVPEVLFAKIEDDQVAEWTRRFAGVDSAA